MPTYNFAAGPATLPQPVLEKVQAELLNFENSHMSILEISHRSPLYTHVYQTAKQNLLDLMHLDATVYDVLFLGGGASLQFTMLPLNLAHKHHRVAYINTGHWSQRAIQEAQKIPGLTVDVLASSENTDGTFTTIPEIPEIPTDTYDYLHITTNNTIMGNAYYELPDTSTPLVADISSNFLGQEYPFEKFDLMYAGAQKNLAPAGLTIVVLKKSLLGQVANLPSMLDYTAQSQKRSALNTPPVFQVYVANLVLEWLKNLGGIEAIAQENQRKAQLLYNCLDNSQLFHNKVAKSYRSLMNVPFVTGSKVLDAEFIQAASQAGLLNLKGHRLVGGMRASLYNAMPYAGVEALCHFIEEFERNHTN